MLDVLNIPQYQASFWAKAPIEVKAITIQYSVIAAIVARIFLAGSEGLAPILKSKGFSIWEASAILGGFTFVLLTTLAGYTYRDGQA